MTEKIAFEEALAELQHLVTGLETGQVTLQDSLARYERGVGLVAHCQSLLDQAHQRIEIVVRRTASGTIETAPFDLPATIDGEAAAATTNRAAKKKPRAAKEAPKELPGLFETGAVVAAPEGEAAPFD